MGSTLLNMSNLSNNQRFTLRAAVFLLLIDGDKILLARRFKTPYKNGEYNFVSGHLDGNETVINTMIREAKEEADLDLLPKSLRVVHTMHRISADYEYIDFYLTADKWTGTAKIMEPDKCDDIGWFKLDNLPKNLVVYNQKFLEYYKRGVSFSDFKHI